MESNVQKESVEVKALVKQAETSAAGRPCRFRAKTVRRLLKCIANGLEINQARKAAGIGRTTLHDWQNR